MKNTSDSRKKSSPEKSSGFFGSKKDPFFERKSTTFNELNSATKQSLSGIFGNDVSQTEIIQGKEGEQVARQHNARAVTFGNQIYFNQGQFRPGTEVGDALLAHEMAHISQQSEAKDSSSVSHTQDPSLEQDANFSMLTFLLGKKFGMKGDPKSDKKKSGMRFSACPSSTSQIEPPSYLGPHSLEALEEINRVIDNTEILSRVIVVGVAVNAGMASPEENIATQGPGDTITAASEALRGIPAIRRARINTIIDFLFLEHENDMNDQEKAFWNRVRELF